MSVISLEKWGSLPMEKRILNIVSELIRAKSCLEDGSMDHLRLSLERVFELMDLTIDSWGEERSSFWHREFLRLREALSEFYVQDKNRGDMLNLIHAFLDMEPACHNLGLQI